jgi:predicted RNA-binding Zn ribbon-like protein
VPQRRRANEPEAPAKSKFEFIAGNPALDFANTVAWPPTGPSNDRLRTYDDLVRWGRETGVLSAAEAGRLRRRAEGEERAANAVLGKARALRRALHELFSAMAHDTKPSAASAGAFARALRDATSRMALTWQDGQFEWSDTDATALESVARRIAWASAELMTSSEAYRVGQCANPNCGWVYLDATKNHSRRWCSMRECGGRAKARRYYQRHRGNDSR